MGRYEEDNVRPAIFHPAALASVRGFPQAARRAIGEAILKLQHGARFGMPLSRQMPSVAPGAAELRVRDRSGVYRVFYDAGCPRGVLVMHAFAKKTRATPGHEIALARRRLKELTDEI